MDSDEEEEYDIDEEEQNSWDDHVLTFDQRAWGLKIAVIADPVNDTLAQALEANMIRNAERRYLYRPWTLRNAVGEICIISHEYTTMADRYRSGATVSAYVLESFRRAIGADSMDIETFLRETQSADIHDSVITTSVWPVQAIGFTDDKLSIAVYRDLTSPELFGFVEADIENGLSVECVYTRNDYASLELNMVMYTALCAYMYKTGRSDQIGEALPAEVIERFRGQNRPSFDLLPIDIKQDFRLYKKRSYL